MAVRLGPADLVLVGGAVVTMDEAGRTAPAVAVLAGRIAALGANREVEELVGPQTRRIDLAGRTLLPGFQDAHCQWSIRPTSPGSGPSARQRTSSPAGRATMPR